MPTERHGSLERELEEELRELEARSQRRSLCEITGVNLCSNDYLGLAEDERLRSAVVEAVRSHGLEVCALTTFGNLLDPDRAARERTRATVHATIDAASALGVGIVVTFPGREEGASEDDNYRQLAEYYAPLAEHAARGNIKIAIENWPGPRINYLATTPAGWARLFEMVPIKLRQWQRMARLIADARGEDDLHVASRLSLCRPSACRYAGHPRAMLILAAGGPMPAPPPRRSRRSRECSCQAVATSR